MGTRDLLRALGVRYAVADGGLGGPNHHRARDARPESHAGDHPTALRSGVAAGSDLAFGETGSPSGREFSRAMVVSGPRAGQGGGAPAMEESLVEPKHLGVEWVATHPYGWIGRDGTVRDRHAEGHDYLERAAAMAERAPSSWF